MKKLAIGILVTILLIGCKSSIFSAKNEYEIKGKGTISLQNTKLELSIDNIEHVDEIAPENASGYYNYYKDEDGYYYYEISGVLINPEQQSVNSENFYMKSKNDNTMFDTKFVIENSNRTTFLFGANTVAEEVKFHIIALVKDGKEPPNEFFLYYQNNLEKNSENNNWDNCLKIII